MIKDVLHTARPQQTYPSRPWFQNSPAKGTTSFGIPTIVTAGRAGTCSPALTEATGSYKFTADRRTCSPALMRATVGYKFAA
ncbi:MAG: hypothetical protein JST64_04600 [Actinobacteria bacterium]|nr:hypothetical protein [Actinomycetota bacterium]